MNNRKDVLLFCGGDDHWIIGDYYQSIERVLMMLCEKNACVRSRGQSDEE